MGTVGLQGDELKLLNNFLIEKRISIRVNKAKGIIESRQFSEAEEYLLDWEMSGEGISKIPKLYDYLREFKINDMNERWEEIVDYIENNDAFYAKILLKKWKSDGNLPDNLDYLEEQIELIEKESREDFTGDIFWHFPEKQLNWFEARKYCQNFSKSNFDDWFLPTRILLNQINIKFKDSGYYWSSDRLMNSEEDIFMK